MNEHERLICTKERPYNANLGRFWSHPDAKGDGGKDGYPGGDIEAFECPHCGKIFRVEIAQ